MVHCELDFKDEPTQLGASQDVGFRQAKALEARQTCSLPVPLEANLYCWHAGLMAKFKAFYPPKLKYRESRLVHCGDPSPSLWIAYE